MNLLKTSLVKQINYKNLKKHFIDKDYETKQTLKWLRNIQIANTPFKIK